MTTSKFDERVTLQSRSTATDAMGQDAITWVDVATVWATVQPLRAGERPAREFFAAAQTQQERTVKVRIRYRSDVQPTWRLVWRGANHDITGVIMGGRREYTDLMCLQGVKDGR